MRINSTCQYLKLIVHALDETIVPDLQSDSSKGIAQIIRTVLLELSKREGEAPAALIACIREGESLESRLLEVLAASDSKLLTVEAIDAGDSFRRLADRHARLTERLDQLTRLVATNRRSAGAELLRRVAEWELSYYEQQSKLPARIESEAVNDTRRPLSRDYLESFLNSKRTRSRIRVESFQPLLGGYGKQTYLCRCKDEETSVETELVVRKTDPLDHMKFGFSALEQEYYLLRSLAKTNFPSPRPDLLELNPAEIDGSFFTMPRIAGKVTGTFLGGVSEAHAEDLYLQLAELMAHLHRLPIETFRDYIHEHGDPAVLTSNTGECYRLNLQAWSRYVQESEFLPSPYLNWLFDWLHHNVPSDARPPVLVHGDFNIHNLLAEDGRVTGVLDWECAGFGAPEQDLAYVRSHISAHIDWNRFVAHYQACGGRALDERMMKFCLVYSTIRLNLGGNKLTYNLQHGANLDIRYAMVDLGFSQAFMQMALNA